MSRIKSLLSVEAVFLAISLLLALYNWAFGLIELAVVLFAWDYLDWDLFARFLIIGSITGIVGSVLYLFGAGVWIIGLSVMIMLLGSSSMVVLAVFRAWMGLEPGTCLRRRILS